MQISMPRGAAHGWGVAGTYLASEIARLEPLPGVTLHGIRTVALDPFDPQVWDQINIGYCFFEDTITVLEYARQAAQRWDYIVAGSSWCEQHLRIGGVRNTTTILQGVDSSLFYPGPKRNLAERFVIFSGGKFELRKGQDLVIAAMKTFMERHDDVLLSCAWYNQWPFSLATMELSKLINYRHREGACLEILAETLSANGIPLDRVILHPLLDNQQMRQVYHNSDVGLFPNRGEGGNNLVMCEYMACGRTVIASDMTGHADVITAGNALPLTSYRPFHYRHHAEGIWFEPSVDEIIEYLEYAYSHRNELRLKGLQAAADMAQLTWSGAAAQFHSLAAKLSNKRLH
ncbi:glycosyltransferase family 4 protein [Trichlorobacter lovleyi]|uniref:glycosyltransferase family 4 protein n=1 Tax=Trichlorobacter lovleyi TaxID=313985 RepID=UPI00223F4CAD|nr:glycosyltransferase family 4 protein [Trichlorobacter lovleyi]QOX80339.1 glycosyltransferase family 4 protein [Trichlorobacter lovleyi]